MIYERLAELLMEEVSENGDDVLADQRLLFRIFDDRLLAYSLGYGRMFVIHKAVKHGVINVLHENYAWDKDTFNALKRFANEYGIDYPTLKDVSMTFAHAIGIDVNDKYFPPRQIKLNKEELAYRTVCMPCMSQFLTVSPLEPEATRVGGIRYGMHVKGRFTHRFRAGIFCVKYYSYNGVPKRALHDSVMYSVPLSVADKVIEGDIFMIVKRGIYRKQGVDRIELSFENADRYRFDDTTRINANDWYKIVE